MWVIGIPLKGHSETSDYAVYSSAELYANTKGADLTHKFWVPLDSENQNTPENYRVVTAGCLRDCDSFDTLVLASHGNEKQIGHWPDAEALANMLRVWGLSSIGTLRLAACECGKESYLPELKKAMTKQGIAVERFEAFTESVSTMKSWTGKVIEVTTGFFAKDWWLGKELYLLTLPGN